MQTDFLVIGSGIAGLTYAVKVATRFPHKQVTIITKAPSDETNTKYAQGGVAVVNDLEHDSFEKHIEDTLIAGDGLCNREVVEIVVTEGPARIDELIEWGAHFDKDLEGDYKLGKEGGHSEFRILHHKDVTGREMERALLEAIRQSPNITLANHLFVIDIITQHHLGYLVTKSTPDICCYGVYVLNAQTNQIEKIVAHTTLLATGGNGQVYRTTTNPYIATGDGVAMVYRAKGRIENMEFIQFHPTALYEAGKRGQAFLITEAVRGDGGILRNAAGEAFMERYDNRKDLAPRDIVARAIDNEMKIGGTEHVYLDCRHMNMQNFTDHFPNIREKCLSIGIDVAVQMIPVAPAAHYSCGGIKTDEWGRSSIQNLYVCGECASTGLHGANRLASNSLLEAMVFAHRCFVASTAAPLSAVAEGVANTEHPRSPTSVLTPTGERSANAQLVPPQREPLPVNDPTNPENISQSQAPTQAPSGVEGWDEAAFTPAPATPGGLRERHSSEAKDGNVVRGGEVIPDWNARGTSEPKEMILITQSLKELQQVMSDYVGIVRNNVRLERAMKRIDLLFEETEELYRTTTVSQQLLELRNMITVGYLITRGASFRKESRGLHYNTDYPQKAAIAQNIIL